MSVSLPDGSTLAIASTYGTGFTVSAITNANPGVATLSSSHGVATGDFFEITSGWPRLNNRIIKAGTVATNDVPLTGVNTSSTATYPAGAGTGTGREITGWQTITQVLDLTSSGGDQQFVNYSFLDSKDEFQIPSVRSPIQIQFRIADDTSAAHFVVLQAADDDRLQRAIRLTLPSGAIILYNAIVTVGQTPSMSKGQVMSIPVTASLQAIPTRY